eukprot:6629388-Karenia_brevis.AAC.1
MKSKNNREVVTWNPDQHQRRKIILERDVPIAVTKSCPYTVADAIMLNGILGIVLMAIDTNHTCRLALLKSTMRRPSIAP